MNCYLEARRCRKEWGRLHLETVATQMQTGTLASHVVFSFFFFPSREELFLGQGFSVFFFLLFSFCHIYPTSGLPTSPTRKLCQSTLFRTVSGMWWGIYSLSACLLPLCAGRSSRAGGTAVNEMRPRPQGALPSRKADPREQMVGSGLRSVRPTKTLDVSLVPNASYPFSPLGFETGESARKVFKASGTDLSP